jgi:hypothetical protein
MRIISGGDRRLPSDKLAAQQTVRGRAERYISSKKRLDTAKLQLADGFKDGEALVTTIPALAKVAGGLVVTALQSTSFFRAYESARQHGYVEEVQIPDTVRSTEPSANQSSAQYMAEMVILQLADN